jgi:alpha-ketoglutarate-dependent taurine dioxygenase
MPSLPVLPATSPVTVDLPAGRPPMLRAEPAGDPVAWAAEHREGLRAIVLKHGSVLVRGLGLGDRTEMTSVFRTLGGTLMTERESFASRRSYASGVYSTSKWPQNQPMCMHHELSYRLEIPSLMLFACLTAPAGGGATGVADSSLVLDALPAELVARFEREGWLLTRAYNDEIGASIEDAFGTEDPSGVERYCRAHGIEFAWQPHGGLHTRQHRSAVVRHPISGRRCWFNQVAFLSEWTMDPEVREYLVDVYGSEALPFTTRYGNGEPIGADVIRIINDAYEAHTLREPWQAGDLMLVDNIRTAHSREAFEGSREVLVAMADPVQLADCAPTVEVTR